MKLYLVRHAQTEWNVLGRAQGHTDIDLDETGRKQLADLTQAFTRVSLQRVWSSDLLRAASTATAVAHGSTCDVEHWTDLRERSFGDWEGEPYQEVHQRLRSAAAEAGLSEFEVRPPGGESLRDLWNRTARVLSSLPTDSESLAIVTHGGVCAHLLAHCLAGTIESTKSFRFENTAVTTLERRPDGIFRLLSFGDTSHLQAPSAPMIDAQSFPNR